MSSGMEPFDRMRLSMLIEEVVAPHRNFGVAIGVTAPEDRSSEPIVSRNPAILYGLGNIVENAVDFAHDRVVIGMQWSGDEIEVTIIDDGPGFAPEVMDKIGEPYVTSRRRKPHSSDEEPMGLGLGFFIAKTLLERSGATLALANLPPPDRGAVVTVRWPRAELEQAPPAAA
jgi:two-component system sensor histidine kinase RegB